MNEDHQSSAFSGRKALRVLWVIVFSLFSVYKIANLVMHSKWNTADEKYVAEWPLPDGQHKLRLLKFEKGLNSYDWVPSLSSPLLESLFSRPSYLREIHLKSRIQQQVDWESIGFLFRVIDDRNQWSDYGHFVTELGIKDSHGYVSYESSDLTREGGATLMETTWIPRRDKELTFQFKFIDADIAKQGKVYDFQLPNPFYREDIPVWQADPPAEKKTVGGRTFMLLEVGNAYRYSPYFLEQATPNSMVSSESLLTFEDPSGNRGRPPSPFEPVWKLKADFFPLLQNIAPEAIRDGREMDVPLVSNTVLLNDTVKVRGATLKIIAICGGGSVSDLGSLSSEHRLRSMYADNEPFVVVQAENIQPGEGIAIRSRYPDEVCGQTMTYLDNGKPVAVSIAKPRHRPPKITLEIAESSTQRFEFLMEPPAHLRKKWQ